MKRWVAYLGGLAVILLLPHGQGMDVGKLQPAEILHIYIEEGATVVATDTGNIGAGKNLKDALESMEGNADGVVFLDTVAYVVVTEDTKDLLPELGKLLRPGTEVVLAPGRMEIKNLARFLRVHDPKIRLCDCLAGRTELPKLMMAGERCYLVQ